MHVEPLVILIGMDYRRKNLLAISIRECTDQVTQSAEGKS